jgi:hypothetical protein
MEIYNHSNQHEKEYGSHILPPTPSSKGPFRVKEAATAI